MSRFPSGSTVYREWSMFSSGTPSLCQLIVGAGCPMARHWSVACRNRSVVYFGISTRWRKIQEKNKKRKKMKHDFNAKYEINKYYWYWSTNLSLNVHSDSLRWRNNGGHTWTYNMLKWRAPWRNPEHLLPTSTFTTPISLPAMFSATQE